MMSAPSGWHRQDDGRERYWDGDAWTDHYRATQTRTDWDPGQPGASRKSGPSRLWLIAVGALGIVALGLVLLNLRGAGGIESAGRECKHTLSVSDDGQSIGLHVLGKDAQNINIATVSTIEAVRCVLDSLEAPSYVRSHIDSTRALDGQQTDDWGDYSARWTYHPDEGLQIVIRER